MKTKPLLYLLALMLIAGFLFRYSTTPESGGPVEIGKAAPAFQLKSLDGKPISLDQYKGKVVLLDFWATWCGPCRLSMPLLDRLQKEIPNDLVLLAINEGDSPDRVKDYVQRQNLQSKILLDLESEVGRSYNSQSIPMQVLIDREGVIRHIQVGFSANMGERLKSEVNKLL